MFLSKGGTENNVPPYVLDPTFFHSLFVKESELEIGDLNDALYYSNVNDVDCTK